MSRPRAWLAAASLLLLGAWVRPPGLGEVTEIRSYDHGEYTRVVIQLSREATYRAQEISSPPRLYVDIDRTWIEAPQRAAQRFEGAEPLVRVRGGQNQVDRARVVLELDADGAHYRAFHLADPFRIVIDVFARKPRGGESRAEGPVPFAERQVRRVVIDPGHGGKDPGATGRGRLHEKNLVLKISREVRKRLEREGMEVLLTRDRDEFLPLEERTARASRWKADLFVSVHANASRNRKTHGVETYLLDTRYDRQTARVAARENGTTIAQLNDLQIILASLRLGYSERYAARLAANVHGSLVKSLRHQHSRTNDLGVKRGPFLVLFMADMPAVLVEVGFLSNRAEAKRLQGDAFTRSAAAGIARGIVAYRDEHARRLLAER
jgi:N-acetylmuramoyl-L-alanine amidase